MGRPKKSETEKPKFETPAFETFPSEPQQAAFVERNTEGVQPKQRFSGFNLLTGDDGKPRVDWESMQGKNKERFIEILKADPEIKKALLGSLAEEEPVAFTKEDAATVLSFLNMVNMNGTALALKFVKKFQIDGDILNEAFKITDPPKKELEERGANLLNKYSPEFVRKYADVFLFSGLYFDLVKNQATAAVMMQFQRNMELQAKAEKEEREKQQKVNGHQIQQTEVTQQV